MTVGRPLTYNAEDVLEQAMQLFWQNGYEATSLHDLTEVMQLSRSSFYQGFGSKHDLFVRCLERYRQQTTEMLWDRLSAASSARDFIADTLRWATEEAFTATEPRGCLIMNTATEFAQRDPSIATRVTDGLESYRNIFEASVQRGQAEGSIRRDREAGVLAGYLVTTMSGLRTMVKAGTDLESLSQLVNVALTAIEQ